MDAATPRDIQMPHPPLYLTSYNSCNQTHMRMHMLKPITERQMLPWSGIAPPRLVNHGYQHPSKTSWEVWPTYGTIISRASHYNSLSGVYWLALYLLLLLLLCNTPINYPTIYLFLFFPFPTFIFYKYFELYFIFFLQIAGTNGLRLGTRATKYFGRQKGTFCHLMVVECLHISLHYAGTCSTYLSWGLFSLIIWFRQV